MTVSNQTARTGPYNGNGSTTVFAYDFRILDQGHVVVTLKDDADVETVQTLTTDYTVSGVGDATGGNITMVVAPASGEQVTFSRAVPQTQEVDLANRGGVQPEVLESAYDKLTQLSQDKVELLSRVPRFPVSSALTDVELPLTLVANTALIVNAGGTGYTTGPTAAQITSAQSYAEAAEAALDEFTDLYLGAKASDPSLDNDGNALQDGALYFDTTLNVPKVYNLGTTTWNRTTPTTGDQANIDTVSGIAANVTTVAGISADVTTVAADGTDIGTVAGISADVTTVAGISSDVTTAATNVADITNFADVYIGPSASDPTQRADTSPLQAGDLYFNTTSNVMKGYTGSAWINTILGTADTPQFASAVLASAGAVRLRMQATGNPADTQNVTFIHDASGGGAYGGMALQNDALTGFRFGLHFWYHPDFTDYPDAAHNIVYGVGLLESGAPAVKATSIMGERVTIAQKWGGGPAPFGVSLGNLYNEPGSLTYNHVKNGTFASDTEWTKGTGWTIAAGVATHASGLESDLSQTINKDLYDDVTYGTLTFTVVAGRSYRLEYTVSGCATGQVQPYVGGTAGTAVSHNGVHSEYITAGADGKVKFTGSTIFDGSIDNVILEETHGFSSDDSVWVAGYNPDGGMIIAGRANASRIVRFMNYGSEVARFGGSADNDYFGINEQSPDRRLHVTDAGTVAKFESSSGAMKIELAGGSTVTVPTIGASGDSVSVDTAAVGGGLQVNLSHASYTGNAFTVQASRAQNAAYSFLAFYSNAGWDLEARCTGEGNFTADGTFTGGGADYAEYFEWADGNPDNEDRRGISVVIEANRIRPALASDPAMSIVGVVSANPTVVGDAQWNKWVGKYERDDFGAYVMEEYEAVEWTECRLKHEAIPSFTRRVPAQAETVEIDGEKSEIVHPARTIVEPGRDAVYEDVPHSYPVDAVPDGLVPPADAVQTTQRRRKLGDGFDPDADYVPRAQRPEWSPVGLMGKLRVRTGQPVGDRWIRLRAVTAAVEEWLVR